MSTSGTPVASGFFTQLMPMLAERTVMMIVSKADEQHLTVSVIPKRLKDSENAALATPLCCTGTPEELDRELPVQVRDFVAGHVALSNNLAEIQREREEAEKREEAKKKQKTVGNGGAKAKATDVKPKEEEKPAQAAAPPMLSLFDSPAKASQPEPCEQPTAPETTAAMATTAPTTGGDT